MTKKSFAIIQQSYSSDCNSHFMNPLGLVVQADSRQEVDAFTQRLTKVAKKLKEIRNEVFAYPQGALNDVHLAAISQQLAQEGLVCKPLPKGGAAMSAQEHREFNRKIEEYKRDNMPYLRREQVLESELRLKLHRENVKAFESKLTQELAGFEKEVKLLKELDGMTDNVDHNDVGVYFAQELREISI